MAAGARPPARRGARPRGDRRRGRALERPRGSGARCGRFGSLRVGRPGIGPSRRIRRVTGPSGLPPDPCRGATRRQFLVGGGLALGGLAVAGVVAQRTLPLRSYWYRWTGQCGPEGPVPADLARPTYGTFRSEVLGADVEYGCMGTGHQPTALRVRFPVCYCLPARGQGPRWVLDRPVHLADFAAQARPDGSIPVLALVAVDGGDTYWHARANGEDRMTMLLDEFIPWYEEAARRRWFAREPRRHGLVDGRLRRAACRRKAAGPVRRRGGGEPRPLALVRRRPRRRLSTTQRDYDENDVFAGVDALADTAVRVDCGRGRHLLRRGARLRRPLRGADRAAGRGGRRRRREGLPRPRLLAARGGRRARLHPPAFSRAESAGERDVRSRLRLRRRRAGTLCRSAQRECRTCSNASCPPARPLLLHRRRRRPGGRRRRSKEAREQGSQDHPVGRRSGCWSPSPSSSSCPTGATTPTRRSRRSRRGTARGTRDLAKQACFDCHSNETVWPWYSNVAPVSWLVQRDVDEGRGRLNFSEWPTARRRPGGDRRRDGRSVVSEGEMPPIQYKPMHSGGRLTDAERQELAAGLEASLAVAAPPRGRLTCPRAASSRAGTASGARHEALGRPVGGEPPRQRGREQGAGLGVVGLDHLERRVHVAQRDAERERRRAARRHELLGVGRRPPGQRLDLDGDASSFATSSA